ncbi:MAG: class I SAM-dependent methyltransferase [Candidatus Pacebacteria bacterium]|nr:class I SAM-dependent methyltransferase [Candidatus Paceibacterota bacterium]
MEKYDNFNYQSHYRDLKTLGGSGLEKTVFKLICRDIAKDRRAIAKILEIGFGKGDLIFKLAENNFNVSGLDISFENVKAVQNTLGERGLRADVRQDDILKSSFDEGEFDVIVACEVIEHLTDLGEAAKEIARILKPGGTLIVSVPYRQKVKLEECIFCHKLTPRDGHLHSFDKEKILSLFRKYDIEVEKTMIHFSKANLFPFLNKIYVFPFSWIINWFDLAISRIFGLFPPFLLVKFRKR